MPRVACAIFFPWVVTKKVNAGSKSLCGENVFLDREVHRGETLIPGTLPERPPPNKNNICKNVNVTSLNMNKGRSGKKRIGRCQENIDIVQEALENNPRGISCRNNGLNLPSATFNHIVSKDLNWHPYRMQMRHGLKPGDFERRLQFCNWFSGHADDYRFIPSMIIGDEAGFSMNARVNSQNVREYARRGQQPNFDDAVPKSRERLTIWVGLCGNGELIGPVFFDRSVFGPSYLQM